MITKTLEAVGMTERQAKLYITGLQSGASSAREIAEQSRENRITTYKTLKEMVLLGYTKESIKEKKAYFSMINPDEILEQQEKKTRVLKESMPELVGLMKSFGERPKIMVYEGLEGLKNVFWSFLNTSEDFRVFVGTQNMSKQFEDFLQKEFVKERLKFKIKTRAIVSSQESEYINYMSDNHETVKVSNKLFDTANQIVVYDYDKVAICLFSENELCGFVICSKTFHDCMAGVFDALFLKSL